MDISVVVPVNGRTQYLRRSIVTILRQPSLQGRIETEILVVDNAVDKHLRDHTRQVCAEALAEFPKTIVDFYYVPARMGDPKRHNGGYPRNVGIRLARAPIVFMADADVLHVTDTVWEHHQIHLKYPNAMVYGYLRDCPADVDLDNSSLQFALKDTQFDLRMAAHTNWFGAMSCSAQRDDLINAGGFDESFRFGWYEDYDLARRMIKHGTTVVRDDSIRSLHQDHPRWWRGRYVMKGYAGLLQLLGTKQANRRRDWGRIAISPDVLRSSKRREGNGICQPAAALCSL